MLFRRKARRQRTLVIGLDCASPELIFDKLNPQLPHLRQLMARGEWGVLRSSTPCITVPAWASMLSGRDPGVLGFYGFRNRAGWDYNSLLSADARSVLVPRVWECVGAADKKVIIANVPQTYPVKPVNGVMISDFLTPDVSHTFTHPPLLRNSILTDYPTYPFDVTDFRTDDKDALLSRLYHLTDTQYRVFQSLLKTEDWDLAMHVNMGVDRVQHGFWRFHDSQHRMYEHNQYSSAIADYYRHVDTWIGRLLNDVDDHTSILVVSDHGVKRMDGAVAINEWLRLTGWLVMKEPLKPGITAFDVKQVDWSRTRAWSTGGYYGRIFLNIAGREPKGIIPADAVDATLDELTAALNTLTDDCGKPMTIRAMRPQDIYQQVNRFAPDLIVYFGDLHWRAVGGLGYGTHFTLENDNGPDDANHAEEGMYLYVPSQAATIGRGEDRQLMDIAPTILQSLGLGTPRSFQGRGLATPV